MADPVVETETFIEDVGKIHTFTNGADNQVVDVIGGNIPTLRKFLKDWSAYILEQIQNQLNVFPIFASNAGAGLIGTTTGNTVQDWIDDLNAKTQQIITPFEFGAIGDGVADDTIPLNLAADYVRAMGGELSGSATYRTTSLVNFRYISVNMPAATIEIDHTSIGVILGNSQGNQSGPKQQIGKITRVVGLDATNPTVRVIGAKGQVVELGRCDYFQVYADTNSDVESTDSSSAYSSFHLQRCSKLELTNNVLTDGSPIQWINENTFHLGRTSTLICSGTYSHNNNMIHAGAFENAVIDFQTGNSNHIFSGRFEGGGTVNAAAGTWGNEIVQVWESNQRSLYESVGLTVTDAGEGNFILRSAEAYFDRVPILTVNAATCQVFTAATINYTSLQGVNVRNFGALSFDCSNNMSVFSTLNNRNLPLIPGEAIQFRANRGRFRVRFYIFDINGAPITDESDPNAGTYLRTNASTSWITSGDYYSQTADTTQALAILKPGTPVAYVGVRILGGSAAAGIPFEEMSLCLISKDKTGRAAMVANQQASIAPAVASSPVLGYAQQLGYKVSSTSGDWFTCTFALKTALTVAAASGAGSITVNSATGVVSGDIVGILLADESTHWTSVNGAPVAGVVTLTAPLPNAANIAAAVTFNRWSVTPFNSAIATVSTATNLTVASAATQLVNAAGGAVSINLPAAATATGLIFSVKKIDASVNAVTLDPNGAETIDGAATLVLLTQWQSAQIQSNGSAWYVLAKN